MKIDEAIKHCEDVANGHEKNCEIYTDDPELYAINREWADNYHHIADWLKALKEIWDSGDCNDCRNGQCEWEPKLGHLVRYNCPHYVGIANGEVNADDKTEDT